VILARICGRYLAKGRKFKDKNKKKPDWALGAKEGEGGAKAPSEGAPSEVEAS